MTDASALRRDASLESPRNEFEETPPVLLYLDMMKRVLTRYGFEKEAGPVRATVQRRSLRALNKLLGGTGLEIVALRDAPTVDPDARREGRDHPAEAETMIGLERLQNLQYCVVDVLRRDVAGDLIETGVWRGGSCIFMRAVLKAFGVVNRKVWVADSFAGLPVSIADFPADVAAPLESPPHLAVSVDDVRANFARYGLLDEQVEFLEGWFKDTLPQRPIEQLAVLRLDGDLYESTYEALEHLYPKLSPGGYVIVDDYGCLEQCRQAVHDYRERHGIREEIRRIDWSGVYWRRDE